MHGDIVGEQGNIRKGRDFLDEAFGKETQGGRVTVQAGRGSSNRSCSILV